MMAKQMEILLVKVVFLKVRQLAKVTQGSTLLGRMRLMSVLTKTRRKELNLLTLLKMILVTTFLTKVKLRTLTKVRIQQAKRKLTSLMKVRLQQTKITQMSSMKVRPLLAMARQVKVRLMPLQMGKTK